MSKPNPLRKVVLRCFREATPKRGQPPDYDVLSCGHLKPFRAWNVHRRRCCYCGKGAPPVNINLTLEHP